MGQGIMNSANTPELRTAEKIWICVDPHKKTITTTKNLLFEDVSTRTYVDDDFSDQIVAAAIEERLK
jgi:hypothetical protein